MRIELLADGKDGFARLGSRVCRVFLSNLLDALNVFTLQSILSLLVAEYHMTRVVALTPTHSSKTSPVRSAATTY